MATEIFMPKLGNTVESVIIVEWYKSVGDAITAGDALCQVETDKASVDVESDASGTLLCQLFQENDEVPVLVPFAAVGQSGEVYSASVSSISEPERMVFETPSIGQSAPIPPSGISPRARHAASLANLKSLPQSGSGPHGRIIERDIVEMINSGTDVETVNTDEFPGPVTQISLTGVRKIIADRMQSSLSQTAQLTLNTSFDAASILYWRQGFKEGHDHMELADISINDLIMFGTARLLSRFPELNSTLVNDQITQYKHVHLGFAVDTSKGLMVPVIRYADRLSLIEFSQQSRHLAQICREGKVSADDLAGGTFTISNLGSFGIESFTPVINTPQTAILGVGSIVNVPVENPDGSLGIGKRMGLSLTIDHQVIDGAPAARFCQELTRLLSRYEWVMAL